MEKTALLQREYGLFCHVHVSNREWVNFWPYKIHKFLKMCISFDPSILPLRNYPKIILTDVFKD